MLFYRLFYSQLTFSLVQEVFIANATQILNIPLLSVLFFNPMIIPQFIINPGMQHLLIHRI